VLQSVIHKLHGTFNFLLSFVFLIVLAEFLRKKSAPASLQPNSVNRSSAVVYEANLPRMIGWNATALSTLVIAMAIWLSGVVESPSNAASPVNLVDLPSSFGSFTASTEAWPDVYQDAKAEQAATRFYTTAEGVPIELFVGYRGDSTGGERLRSPKLVLPARWSYLWITSTQLQVNGSEPIEANWMLTQTAGARRLVVYWYQSERTTFTGELYYRFALLKERLMGRSAGMLVVRIATPVLESDRSVEQAQIRLKNLALRVQQELDRIIHVRRGFP
jgi:EpsI family protein